MSLVLWHRLADRGVQARTAVEAEAARLQSLPARNGLLVSFVARLTGEPGR